MTNTELIAKIKAEIERRREANKRQYHSSAGGMSWQRMCGEEDCLVELLSFLSTLEEQPKGYDEAYIQSKIAKASETWKGVDVDEYLSQVRGEVRNPIFDECVAKADPKVMEEVERNIDRMLEDDSLIDEIKNFIEEYGYERGEDKLLIAIVARHFYELGCTRTAEKYDEIEYNRQRAEQRWLEDRDGCFWDGVNEGKKAMEDAILALIESRLSEIIGDAQPKPALRAELQELITKCQSLI